MNYYENIGVGILLGKTITSIENKGDQLDFTCSDGSEYSMYHNQDCCEKVKIEDICGDLEDLLNSPILQAEENTNKDAQPDKEYDESFTWTFYKFGTIKGGLTIRWLGESNGYYSETVDFVQTKAPS